MLIQRKCNVLSMKYVYTKFNDAGLNYSELYRNLYDEQNRLIEIRDGSDMLYVSNIYDAYGKLTTHRYGRIKVDSTYDSTGLKTSDKYEYVTDGNERKYDYEYASDSSRRLKKLTTDNYTEEYETDGLERTTKVKKSFGNCEFSERYGYYKNGDHATTRINTITYGKNGVSDGKVTYTYDKFGNIISVNENGKQRSKYAFDAIGRLVSEKDIDNNKEICYNYDSQGNIEAKWLPDGTVKRYCYQEDSDLLIRFGSERFEYDQLGNPTVYRDMTCTWNLTRLLTSVKDGTNTINFEYDIFGRRTRKFCNDSETVFEYDENNLIRQIHNGKTTEFIYGKNGIVGFVYNNKTYYFRKNIFGDVERIYNDNGTVVGRYSYSAFGECEIKLDTDNIASLNPIRYRGYYFDDELGLYYLQSRYYDPEIGRFISADSIEYADPGHVNGLNLYAYCNNNPIMNVDFTGHSWMSFWKGIGEWFGNIGSWFKNTFGLFVEITNNIISYAEDHIVFGWEIGTDAGYTKGDDSKYFAFFVSRPSEWWKLWEYQFGIKIGKFSMSTPLLFGKFSVSWSHDEYTTYNFQYGLNKIIFGSSHTNNGITNYEQRYVSVLPLALVAVGVMMVPESTPLLLVGLKIFAK